VRPEAALLVTQTPFELRKPGREIVECGTERPAADLDLSLFTGVATQRRGQEQP
jgi:hypothetical protein